MATQPTTPGQRAALLSYHVDRKGKHRWQIKSSNGKVLAASSQGYATPVDARKNCMLLGALLSGYDGLYEDLLTAAGHPGVVKLWK